ncbi:MAG: efflux RND transporter periplasmic adaptor subunit [Gallionellaceae bacterium]|nr:efflux RND transporter periplasmic adaptor subunit [Gallionellaceae bacterium]
MRLTIKHWIIAIAILIMAAGGYYAAQSKSQPAAQQRNGPTQTIKTVLAQKKSIPITVNANGYVIAINTVDVRPQIQQIVQAVHVKEGQEVSAGQLLFTLDSRNEVANVDKAKAQLVRDQADQADAEAALQRNLQLLDKNFVSQAAVDTARNKVESLRGTVRADQAAIEASKIALSYNRITASISGRIGTINVHPGSLAQASGSAMLTITQLNPIAVSFAVPERELAFINATYPKGDAPIIAQLPEGKSIKGKLIFIDNSADQQSGTIRMKAQFTNRDHKLWPGAFVNVSLTSRTLSDAIVVPSQAVITGPSDQFVYVVQPDSTVQIQKVQVTAMDDGQTAVTGLDEGTPVVMEGTQNLRPGAKVKEAQAASPDNEKQNSPVKDKHKPNAS